MTNLFLLGATGYVGGQVLKELTQNFPYFKISALVRNAQVAKQISSLYPNVNIVVGSLDDSDLVKQEASKASIVLNAASNKHMGGARAIHRGLSKRESPSYWVQMSGASLLAVKDLSSPTYDVGLPSSKVFNDLEGADEIRTLIKDHPSREIDNYLLKVSETTPQIRTALVIPPMIYGKGEGPVNQRSVQIPSLAKLALEKGHVVRPGAGKNIWGHSHVADVARLFAALAEQGAQGRDKEGLWNENGLYFTSAGEMSFAEISDRVSKAANEQGLIASTTVEQLSKEDSDKTLPHGSVLFGSNARGTALRATILFGWKPVKERLEVEIPRAVAKESSQDRDLISRVVGKERL